MLNALLPIGALLVGIVIGRRLGRNEGLAAMYVILNAAHEVEDVPQWIKDQRAAARDQ